jgi:hypothetical protein
MLLACDKALLLGTGLFLVVLLLSSVLRRDWLAAIAGWLLITTRFLLAHESWTDFFFACLASALLMICILRFGLLSQVSYLLESLAGRGISLSFFLFFAFWVTSWKSAREANTSRLLCFTTGFPGAPNGPTP